MKLPADLVARVREHQARMQAAADVGVNVTQAAAIVNLLEKGLAA